MTEPSNKATERWWEPRRDGERTFAYLSRVLEELGAKRLAVKALKAHYDDFECPPEIDDGFNIHRLVNDLEQWRRRATREQRRRAEQVISAAVVGEFDSTKEESDRYAASARGQADLRALFNDLPGGTK